jgi:hypothetical protein
VRIAIPAGSGVFPPMQLQEQAMRTLQKTALKNSIQRLREPGDRAFDIMQFI